MVLNLNEEGGTVLDTGEIIRAIGQVGGGCRSGGVNEDENNSTVDSDSDSDNVNEL